MLLVVLEAFPALGDGGDVAGGDPPKAVVGLVGLFEPGAALFEEFQMAGVVGVVLEGVGRGPDAHVDDEEGVVAVGDVGGVAAVGFETPDVAWAGLGEGVDGVELGDEARDEGVIDGGDEAAYVDLGEMKALHVEC